jgi:hypothetical protein
MPVLVEVHNPDEGEYPGSFAFAFELSAHFHFENYNVIIVKLISVVFTSKVT